jgi:DNA polymerase V
MVGLTVNATKPASAGLQGKERAWCMKQNLLTSQYTTRWDDMPVVRA